MLGHAKIPREKLIVRFELFARASGFNCWWPVPIVMRGLLLEASFQAKSNHDGEEVGPR